MNHGLVLSALEGIFPIVALIALGFWLARLRFLGTAFIADLNKLAYWIALPAFLFTNLAQAEIVHSFLWQAGLVLLAGSLLVGSLGYAAALRAGRPPMDCATIAQAAFRSNVSYVGLPVLVFCLPAASLHIKLAVLALAPVTAVYNLLSVGLFSMAAGKGWRGSLRLLAVSLLLHPLLLASVAGLMLAVSGVQLPAVTVKPLTMLGAVALPVALLCIGGSLAEFRFGEATRDSMLPVCCKLIVAPVAAWGFCRMLGLGEAETLILVVYAACPTAASAYTLAAQMGGNARLTSACVALSTILAIIPIVFVLGRQVSG